MKKTITKIMMLALLGLSTIANAQSPDYQWAASIGGTGSDYGYSITTDALGNVCTTGYFSDTVDFDPGAGVFNLTGGGGFISKLDKSGNFIWAKAIGGGGTSIAIDNGGSGDVYTTGGFTGTVDFDPGVGTFNLTSTGGLAFFISKLDSSGNFVWAKKMGSINGGDSFGTSIAIGSSGGIYTTGYFRGAVDFNPGAGGFVLASVGISYDIFISKLDTAGNFVMAKRMGGPSDDLGYSIAIDALGNIYTTGSFEDSVDFNPGTGVFSLTAPGFTPFNGTPPSDIFISKLDNAGNFIWAKQMGGTSDDYAMSITIDHAGSGAIYTTGGFHGTADFDPGVGVFNLIGAPTVGQFTTSSIFVSRLDTAGNFVWAKRIGGIRDRGNSIATDTFGNIYTTGYFTGTSDFDPGVDTFNLTTVGSQDIFISKLNSSGNFVWAQAAGGAGYDYGLSIAVDASGSAHLAGYYRSPSIMFGSTWAFGNVGATNTSDLFIAKLDTLNIPAGISPLSFGEGLGVMLFPNPATNHLTIALGNNNKKVDVTIVDITGKLIYKTTLTAIQKIEVNTQDFAAGIYAVQLQSADFIATKKLVIEK